MIIKPILYLCLPLFNALISFILQQEIEDLNGKLESRNERVKQLEKEVVSLTQEVSSRYLQNTSAGLLTYELYWCCYKSY